jgi:hypothetical protein
MATAAILRISFLLIGIDAGPQGPRLPFPVPVGNRLSSTC